MEDLEKEDISQNKTKFIEKLTFVLIIATLSVIIFNAFSINSINISNDNVPIPTGNVVVETASSGPDVAPKGIPGIYGKELGISFDDVSSSNPQKAESTINKLGILDQQITLKENDLERYISIASKIGCEYCCGAPSIIFKDGRAACGCAHSFAMRGLAKYLIKNHGAEYADDSILEELGKWKTLFFPAPMTKKAKILQSQGIELSYINLASNKYRGIENGK